MSKTHKELDKWQFALLIVALKKSFQGQTILSFYVCWFFFSLLICNFLYIFSLFLKINRLIGTESSVWVSKVKWLWRLKWSQKLFILFFSFLDGVDELESDDLVNITNLFLIDQKSDSRLSVLWPLLFPLLYIYHFITDINRCKDG